MPQEVQEELAIVAERHQRDFRLPSERGLARRTATATATASLVVVPSETENRGAIPTVEAVVPLTLAPGGRVPEVIQRDNDLRPMRFMHIGLLAARAVCSDQWYVIALHRGGVADSAMIDGKRRVLRWDKTPAAEGDSSDMLRYLTAPDALPVDKPLTVVVKSSALCAVLLIGVGVLVGYLLRRYGTRDRPRLLQQRRLLVLASEMSTLEREAGQLNDDEKGVFALIRRWIDDLYEDVQIGIVKDSDSVIELLDKKLTLIPLWVNARRRVEAVRPAVLAEPFRAKLDLVRNFLREKKPAQDALKQAQDALDALPAEIAKAVKDDLSKRLNDFSEEVKRLQQRAKDPHILDALRDKVEPAIARAAGDVNAERFDAARATFDEARREYARLLAEDLRASLDAAPVPSGFDTAQWEALKSEVAARLDQVSSTSDPDAALAAYRAAYTGYLQKLAGALHGEVKERHAKLKAEADKFTAEDLKSHTDDLNGIFRLLDGVARRLAAGELTEAASEYQQAKDALTGIDLKLKAGGVSMGMASSAAPADALPAGAIPGPGGELPTVAVLGREPRERPTVQSLTQRLRWYDIAVTFAIFPVAVALGLYLLWVNDSTWGTWGDWLTAVLWGLGLHRVANAPVELSGLREKLISPTTGG